MRIWLIVALLLPYFAEAQPPAYKPFEVDSVAEPRGGLEAIDSYVQISLRKPVPALAKGVKGRVLLTGIVEPNGHISGVSVLRGLQADCDTEAVRVFSTFNAWKPAFKAGKPVRQHVTYPVVFKPNKPFVYVNGSRVNYLDMDKRPVDSTNWKTRYKLVAPMQSNWLPTNDIVLYRRKWASSWVEDTRYTLVREELKTTTSTGKRITRLSYRTPTKELYDQSYEIDEDSTILSTITYDNEGVPFDLFIYAANGALREVIRNYRSTVTLNKTGMTNGGKLSMTKHVTTWYPTGQLYGIGFIDQADQLLHIPAMWDSLGTPLVSKGYGTAIFRDVKPSYLDTTRQTLVMETGPVAETLKQGTWTGRYADGSYFYEEQYNKGICRGGKAWSAGVDTVRYATLGSPPEFQGGMAELERFLKKNLRYPTNVRRKKTPEKVLVSFVIDTDGTLSDYAVVKRTHPELDQEAIRVATLMSGHWKPAIERGRKVRVKYSLPISFSVI